MSRSRSLDDRLWLRLSVDTHQNPKLLEIDPVDTAGWTYTTGLECAAQGLTDGEISPMVVMRQAQTVSRWVMLREREMSVAQALIEQGLWHAPGHTCLRCPQPQFGRVYIHDYLEHQQSRAERAELSEKRRKAGDAGRATRYGKNRDQDPLPGVEKPDDSAGLASASTDASANATAGASAGAKADDLALAERLLAQEQPAPAKARRGPQRSLLPQPFPLSTQLRGWASVNTPNVHLEREHEHFCSHYHATAIPAADWPEMWRKWMRKEQDSAVARRGRNAGWRAPVYTNAADPAQALLDQEARRG